LRGGDSCPLSPFTTPASEPFLHQLRGLGSIPVAPFPLTGFGPDSHRVKGSAIFNALGGRSWHHSVAIIW